MAGLVRRIFPRQFAPLRASAQYPQNPVEHGSRILPRTPSPVGASLRAQNRFDPLPLGVTEFPPSSHTLLLPVSSRPANSYVGSTTIYETGSRGFWHLPMPISGEVTERKQSVWKFMVCEGLQVVAKTGG